MSVVRYLPQHFIRILNCYCHRRTLIVVFSGGRDNIVMVWDIKAFEKKKTIPVYEVCNVFLFSF